MRNGKRRMGYEMVWGVYIYICWCVLGVGLWCGGGCWGLCHSKWKQSPATWWRVTGEPWSFHLHCWCGMSMRFLCQWFADSSESSICWWLTSTEFYYTPDLLLFLLGTGIDHVQDVQGNIFTYAYAVIGLRKAFMSCSPLVTDHFFYSSWWILTGDISPKLRP